MRRFIGSFSFMEVLICKIEEHKCATLGIAMKNSKYKDRGFGLVRTESVLFWISGCFQNIVGMEQDMPVLKLLRDIQRQMVHCIMSYTERRKISFVFGKV